VEKGFHLALVHTGESFHKDLWIVFLEVPVENQRLFRFSLEKILDREVAQPLERRGSAPCRKRSERTSRKVGSDGSNAKENTCC
jgi:hypothetical protein